MTTIDIIVPTTKKVTVPTPHMVDTTTAKWRIWTETSMDYVARTRDIWYNEDAGISKKQHDQIVDAYFNNCDAYVSTFRRYYKNPAVLGYKTPEEVPGGKDVRLMEWRIDIPTGMVRTKPPYTPMVCVTLYGYKEEVRMANLGVYNEPSPNSLHLAHLITHTFVKDHAQRQIDAFWQSASDKD